MKKSLSFLLALAMVIATFAGLSMTTEAADVDAYTYANGTHTWSVSGITWNAKDNVPAGTETGSQYMLDLGGNLKMSTTAGNESDQLRSLGYISWANNYTYNRKSYLEFTPEKSGTLTVQHWASGTKYVLIAPSLPEDGGREKPADAVFYGDAKPATAKLIGGTTYYIAQVAPTGSTDTGTVAFHTSIKYVEDLQEVSATGIKWDFTDARAWAWDTNYDGLTFTKGGWSWLPSASGQTTWAIGAGGYITFTPAKDGTLDFTYGRRVGGTYLSISKTNGETDASKILAKTTNADGKLSALLDPAYPASNLNLKAGETYYIYGNEQFKFSDITYTYIPDKTPTPAPTATPTPTPEPTATPTPAPTPVPGAAEVTEEGLTWTFDSARTWAWGKDYNGLTLVKGTTGWNTLPTGSDNFVRIGKSAQTSEDDGGFIKFTPTKNGAIDIYYVKEGPATDGLYLNTTPFEFDADEVVAYTVTNYEMSKNLAAGSLELEAGKTYYIYPKLDRTRVYWVTYTYLPDATPTPEPTATPTPTPEPTATPVPEVAPEMVSEATFGKVESKFFLRYKTDVEKKEEAEYEGYGFYFVNFASGSENDASATETPDEMPTANIVEAAGDLDTVDSFSTDIDVTGTTAKKTGFYAIPFVKVKATGTVFWGTPFFYDGDITN